jgi:type III restriction enzyme
VAGAAIENPIINTPFTGPARHFLTAPDGTVSGEITEGRRPSEFFVPVARPKKTSAQLTMDAFGGPIRQQPNEIVNEIRQSVDRWRRQGYPHTTGVTRDLLEHWQDADRQRRLFFCQLEAVETAIYLTETTEKTGDTETLNGTRRWSPTQLLWIEAVNDWGGAARPDFLEFTDPWDAEQTDPARSSRARAHPERVKQGFELGD